MVCNIIIYSFHLVLFSALDMFVFVANSNIQFLKFYYSINLFLVGASLNTDGALRFPVPDATVIRGDSLQEVAFFVACLGTTSYS